MTRVLIIAPHADDAELGLGGFIARMIRQNLHTPSVRIVASGDYVNRQGVHVSGEERLRETMNAMNALGVDDYRTDGSIPENEFDKIGRSVLVDVIDSFITNENFEEVFFPLTSFNQDHQALHEAILTAFRPNRHSQVKKLWAYEYPGNSVADMPLWGRFYLPLGHEDMARKLKSLACHKSQNMISDNHISTKGAEALARLRGSECGVEFAEVVNLWRGTYRAVI